MTTVNNACDYVITLLKSEDNFNLSNLKLQKLLYYCQAWHLGIHKEPLFEEDFQAWIHGPVCRVIYDRFLQNKNLYSSIELEDRHIDDFSVITDVEKEHIKYILENYAGLSGIQLEIMTHREDPWIIARGKKGEFERCENIITKESMKKYYGSKWKEINENPD